MTHQQHQPWMGRALVLSGLLGYLVNGILTPMMPMDLTFTELASSDIFLLRLSLAIALTALHVIAAIGIYGRQRTHVGWYGSFAVGVLFLGSLVVFAHEWAQVFFIHPMANSMPGALEALEDFDGMNLFDWEAAIALGLYMTGWLLLGISALMSGAFNRIGPALVVIGLFAVPLLAVALSPMIGQSLGNVILSSGWLLMGLDMIRKPKA
ncbi:MAG: hypothetical protein P8J78_02410 [Maricaulis sp.]|nr:hypothetical protein [Maricaulis sp.]